MKYNSVPKADGLIIDERRTRTPGESEGIKPRPIRLKGYYRALKRKECWAVYVDYIEKFLNPLTRHEGKNINHDCENQECPVIVMFGKRRANEQF